MELIFKKYSRQEKNYLIFDPEYNNLPFTGELAKSISQRNFVQNCEGILVGPVLQDKKVTVRALASDGNEVSVDTTARQIFSKYLEDRGHTHAASHTSEDNSSIRAFGTVYYFPA